ncbi:hypothetical protein PHJA_002354600 [Phtheirospermum japonicum]|uniref:Uncharacterized protein n=1 Tax=Phtheirospermum japonicum TaxID=374723 RepID=A0A830CSD1_9LAMI|nr:hypothetical protein PHJA_002354600 [Phtheirospermum japonicum]
MEKKRDAKHLDKHRQHHRPRDAFELYEIEHMPRTLVKVPSDHHAKPHAPESNRPDYYDAQRKGDRYWCPKEEDNEGNIHTKVNIDVEAEMFIMLEHEKFERSRWMSRNDY